MSKRSDELLVADIREAVDKIQRYTSDMDETAFTAQELVVDAVIRNIEVIGEAAAKLSEEYIQTHADVPFRKMTATRNRLIHGYFGINISILWRVVREDLPLLIEKL
jgi:uncharacterized protein with HEPN domain